MAQTRSRSSHVALLALACAFAIATLYYSQPILPLIGATFGTGDTLTSQIVTVGQIGYALGTVPVRPDRRPHRPPPPDPDAAGRQHGGHGGVRGGAELRHC